MSKLVHRGQALPSRRETFGRAERMKNRGRFRRHSVLEQLEQRTLLAYTFTYNAVTHVATAAGDAATDALVISPIGGLLAHSVNGSAFDTDWSGSNVPAAVTETVDVNVGTGDGSSVQLGGVGPGGGGAASLLFAAFDVVAPANTTDTATIDDSGGGTLAAYVIDTLPGFISGPGIDFDQSGSAAFQGGVTLKGSSVDGNTYAVLSVCCAGANHEPMTVQTGATGLQTVNVGNGGTLGNIRSDLSIFDPAGDPTTININDAADTTHSTATLDNLSGDPNAPFEVTGLSPAPIKYGIGVTALNINGGTFGAAGVTYNINNTQSGTTTTINGGPNQNFINLSNPAQAGGLDNLPGPVVVHGGLSFTDVVTLEDSSANFSDNYTVNATTVNRGGPFGGLTYDDNIGTLSLFAENTLGTNGNNAINVDDTADFVITNINGQGGVDTINVNDTGFFGVLNVVTGPLDGSTVNVVANNQPVNVTSNALATVNIGSTGGPGSMAGIQGPVSVTNPPSLTDLNFHDENDVTGQTWTLDNDDGVPTGSVAVTGSATTSYNPFDLASLTVNGGSGGNAFIVNNTSAFFPTTLNTGLGGDEVDVFATGSNTLDIHGQGGQDTATLGADPVVGMQNLFGTINVDNTFGFTSLLLDDSQDPVGQVASLTNNGTDGSVTGLSPATINYVNTDISDMTVNGGSGGNDFTVNGTLANLSFVPTLTTLNKGTGFFNSVEVLATNAGSLLAIHGQGGPGSTDDITIGDNGNLDNILGLITIDELNGGLTFLIINLSNDGHPHILDLSSDGTTSTLHDENGFLPMDIMYDTASLGGLTIDTDGSQDQLLNLDFGQGGNPIPQGGTPGLVYNAGDPGPFVTHAMNIFGELPSGPFDSETHNANDPSVLPDVGQYGSIFFTEGGGGPDTSLNYTGLQPIDDTAPAVFYTFNDFADDQSFTAQDGPPVLGFDTIQFVNTPAIPSPPTFETTNIANKNFVDFNTPGGGPGIIGVVDITTPSTGLLALTFNLLTNGDNTVFVQNTPPGVVSSVNGGADEDTTNVTGLGVAAGTVLFLNGGAAHNDLNYDAGGLIPTISPGLLPGEVLISVPGAGIVDAVNYEHIHILNAAPTPPPAVTPTDPLNSIEGFQLVDAVLGTFTFDLTGLFPPGTILPAGLPAGAFTATYEWGDGTSTAATVTQDASNPSVYHVTGSHTYANPGLFLTALTVSFVGGPVTGVVNGVPVTLDLPPATATPGGITFANVSDGILAVTAFPIVGTEGQTIASAPIATFIDGGGADSVGDYSATIAITDSNGFSVLIPAASIVQVGTSAQFTVIAPDIVLPEEGVYQILVTVTDSGPLSTITGTGASVAVIADAALTPGPAVLLSPTTGVNFSGDVADFTDANLNAPASDFTAIIDWGDGSPTSVGSIVGAGGAYSVNGSHTYTKPGIFTTTVVVKDVGGATVTLFGSATVSDAAVTGATRNFVATEGIDTGEFVLATFTDPNPFATVSDVSAALAVGGWGDGTPGIAGITLVVRQIGATPAGAIFQVLGSHVYAEETPPGLPNTLSVIVTTFGGVTTTLTSPPGGGVTVRDAALSSSNGTTITGVEGNSTGTVLLGSFRDDNQFATAADFTTAPGSTIVFWGDGSSDALTAADFAAIGSPNGVTFTVGSAHTYAEEGVYAYTVVVTDDGGSTTVISGTAIIADALLAAPAQNAINTTESAIFPVPVFGTPVFSSFTSNVPVATFTDGNPLATTADFTAIIDWGDGTAPTAGTIEPPLLGGMVFRVFGSHTYASSGVNSATNGGLPGIYNIQVFITDDGESRLTVKNTANVADIPIALSGILNPGSDSGESNSDAITNVKQPDFFGTSQPFSHVSLFATALGGGFSLPIGQVEAGSDGTWNIVSTVALADGAYRITATATDQFLQTTTVAPVTITPNLVIDTIGPKITDVFFDRFNGQIDVTYRDERSGMDQNTILDGINYFLTKQHTRPPAFLVTDVSTLAPLNPTDSQLVIVTINNGHALHGGRYTFTIYAANVIRTSGVQDVAGNSLDGEFYGTFPTGNNIPGGNFVAILDTIHHKIFPPAPTRTTAPPPRGINGNGGGGGGAGAESIQAARAKAQSQRAIVLQQQADRRAALHDAALALVSVPKKARRRP
jgi:Bacterial Ig-like domain